MYFKDLTVIFIVCNRCLADFQFEKFLAKGGFGTVFQAKHNVDSCSYAIKRIGPLRYAIFEVQMFISFDISIFHSNLIQIVVQLTNTYTRNAKNNLA